MTLLIGQAVNARELEQATSQWSPERFASMCNDLVWAVSGRKYSNLPRFTARVYAADDGVDAEWDVEIPGAGKGLTTPIVGPDWNVFQYKKRDLIAQDRRRIISNLKSGLKKALASVAKKKGRHPDRYVLFVNVDLRGDDVASLRESILHDYDRCSQVHVEVIGAGGIAAFLNDNPHLRAAYFNPLSFKTWEEGDRSHRAQKLFRLDVELVDREDELNRLRSLVEDPRVRTVVVTGPHDIGKSRLVLEATSQRSRHVVFALDPRSMRLEDYRSLVTERKSIVCVVEDPDPDKAESLVNEVLGIEGLKVIITLPSSEQAPFASYGRDERVQLLSLDPLNDEKSRKLLNATGKRLDFGVESWILDQAGGNPGILLAAVSIGERLRIEGQDFTVGVGREFEKRIKSELGKDVLKCAQLLSPLTHVGISGKFESELKVICDLFGESWKAPNVLSTLRILEEAGLARRGGSFAEITIPILANYLTAKLLRGRKDEVFALFGRLEGPARLRFLRRLSQVEGGEAEAFWDALFDPHDTQAPFASLRSALMHAHILRLVAGTVPERTMQLIRSGLVGKSRDERLAIVEEPRRELMWALEQLLFRAKTSRRALKLIWLLAEAENEKWGNNATGVLSECFHPMHSQMPLPLSERLDALREFTSKVSSKEGKLVAIQAASRALESGAYTLRHSTGAELLDKRPIFTYGDLFKYTRDLVDHVFSLAETEETEVAEATLEKLPRLVFELGVQGQPKEALERFKRLIEWTKTERPGLDVFSLAENIEALRQSLERHLQESEMGDDRKMESQGYVAEVNRLKGMLEKGSFSIRLKRWAAGWSIEDVDGSRSEVELTKLAKETISNPALLDNELLSWLLSGRAQNSHRYFFAVGSHDLQGRLRVKMEEIGSKASGANAFSAYWGGWARVNRTETEERLVELASSNRVRGEAIVGAAGYFGSSPAMLGVVKEQVLKGLVAPKVASAILYGDWINNLLEDQFLDLLKVIAGTRLENAALAIDVLGRWLYKDRPLEGELAEFAWRYLEAAPPVTSTSREAYDCERLAAKLTESNIERGFRLLEKLLTQPHDRNAWNPIDRYGARENEFWNLLHKADRERALRTILSVAMADPLKHFQITWDFRDVVDQQRDADLLIKLAIENEHQAEVIAESITTARPGFWPVALKLLEKYPSSPKIQSALIGGIEQLGEAHWGPYSSRLESCRKEVEGVLNDPATPPAARLWVQEVLSGLESDVGQNIVWEYDQNVNDLRRYIKDKDSPERIWAISRVLKYAELKDIRKLLTVEDIEEALPQVDLPEKKRRALERAIEVWQSGS